MSIPAEPQAGRPTDAERRELDELMQVVRSTTPRVSRRDFVRWSAIAAGAVATARYGVSPAAAAPAGRTGASARFQDGEIEQNATINVPLDPFGQPVTLDPHRTVNWGPFWALLPNVWSGLVRYDELGKVQLDLAESYEVSEDGKTYTFRIRQDATFANGKQVVADDFIASWKRALDSRKLSPMAEYMQPLRGWRRYTSGRSEEIGFSAVDESTVEIVLSRSYSYFMSYLAAFVWAVIDPEVLKAEGDEGFALKDAGAGPWRFTEFDAATQVVMEPNTNYHGGNSPSITKIVWPFVTGPTAAATALNLYKQDKAISADVPLSLKSSVERDPDLSDQLTSIAPEGTIRAIGMDFKQPPFNDVRVRRALALAIDREQWANEIWEGTWTPSGVFVPPVVNAISGYISPDPMATDVDQAKKLLEDAGFPNGEGLPPITYHEPSEDSDDEKSRWQTFLGTIKDAIGVTIEHDTSRTLDQIQDLRNDDGGLQFDITWWWNVTETPHLLSQVMASESSFMKGVFNWGQGLETSGDFDPSADSKEFDRLTEKADLELDQDTRNGLYKQAEELALKNAVYIPLGNWKQQYVQKPWIQGTRQGPWLGRIPALFDKDVVVLKHESTAAGTPTS